MDRQKAVSAAWTDNNITLLFEKTEKESELSTLKRKDLQFIPFDVVEEALIRAHSLGLDWFKQVLAIVGEGTHQEVLLITETTPENVWLFVHN